MDSSEIKRVKIDNSEKPEKTFRDVFKKYKRKDVPLDLKDVVNLNNCDKMVKYKKIKLYNENENEIEKLDWESLFGMNPPTEWEIYDILDEAGLLFLKNPFKASGQRYWILRCLECFTQKPNKLNIDPHNLIPSNEDWWEYCQRMNDSKQKQILLEKLRWATMGYHHNWDTKIYSEESKNDFPSDLKSLCSCIAEKLGFLNFQAEAAIVNFYHYDSTLSGHTDHSEANMDAPLFSFSFGQSAIFLIGGKSLENEPTPILVESGDIIIMSKESRSYYHGVPRILPSEQKPWNFTSTKNLCDTYFEAKIIRKLNDDETWKPFDEYVSKSRINMNVRQVLLPGQKSL